MSILEKVKSNLRLSGNEFDEEVKQLIISASQFITTSGVNHTLDSEALDNKNYQIDNSILTLIVLFCKAYFGIQDTKDIDLPGLFYITLKQLQVSDNSIVGGTNATMG